MPTEANSLNAATTGIVGNTGTSFTGTAATQYNVIVGGATSSTLANVAPSATAGVPLISAGSSANPSFGTAVVAGGGTGVATMTTAYAPVCAGTTATGALQVASTGLSTSGYVLTSTGASSLPTFQAVPSGGLTLIESHTPSASTFDVIFTAGGLTSYNNLLFIISGTEPIAATNYLTMLYSTNGGSSFTAYASIVTEFYGTTVASYNASGQITPPLTSSVPGNGVSMQIWIGNPNKSGNIYQSLYGFGSTQESVNGNCFFNVYAQANVAANAYKFFANGVGINTVGHFACYGIN